MQAWLSESHKLAGERSQLERKLRADEDLLGKEVERVRLDGRELDRARLQEGGAHKKTLAALKRNLLHLQNKLQFGQGKSNKYVSEVQTLLEQFEVRPSQLF
jgi:hypothetical protein